MLEILVMWAAVAAAIVAAARLFPGVEVDGWGPAFLGAFVLGILNVMVKPLLVFLTLPLTFLTLGLFLLVVNAIVFSLAGFLVPRFRVKGFWSALFASLFVSLVGAVANWALA